MNIEWELRVCDLWIKNQCLDPTYQKFVNPSFFVNRYFYFYFFWNITLKSSAQTIFVCPLSKFLKNQYFDLNPNPWAQQKMPSLELYGQFIIFLIGIQSMQGWTVTTRHGVTRKRSTKRLEHTGNLFRRNLQLEDVC